MELLDLSMEININCEKRNPIEYRYGDMFLMQKKMAMRHYEIAQSRCESRTVQSDTL